LLDRGSQLHSVDDALQFLDDGAVIQTFFAENGGRLAG